jgi:xanthine dehydrogenase YagS FAD-binding subunit
MNRFTLVRLPTLAQAGKRVRGDAAAREFRAGGIDLLDRMKEGLDEPDELVELHAISGDEGRRMRGIERREKGGFRIGALVTMAQVADYEELPSGHAALGQAAGSAATPAIRNAATVGGNLLQRPRCWYFRNAYFHHRGSDSANLARDGENQYHAIFDNARSAMVHASTLATALVAYDARVELYGPQGKQREIALKDFFLPPDMTRDRDTVIEAGEVLTRVVVPPLAAGTCAAYHKQTERESYDWPICDVAVVLQMEGRRVRAAAIVMGWIAPTPRRAVESERVLTGRDLREDLVREAARVAVAGATPLSKNAYKVPVLEAVVRRTILAAATA